MGNSISHEPAGTTEVYAPCVAGCPVHTDTREFVECILRGDYEAAAELVLSANPFSSVCGRICHHPCEQQCRRSKIEAPVALRRLKRFVLEAAKDWRLARRADVPTTREQSVAVVGSGPSGLTAAHDLARQGFRVTVFEKLDSLGGMLGLTIPRYRLPFEVLQEDIDDILALGVKVVTGCEVGKDVTLAELREQGFSAILLAGGLSESHTLAVPGIDSEGVYLALPFLRTVRAGGRVELGSRVVVIGGGNVASDVARSARRLGAEQVTMVCLESRQEMPAYDWELEEALEENVQILSSWGPKTLFAEEGRIRGMELRRCLRVFDEEGRFNPDFDDRDVRTLPADSVVLAIGQHAELGALRGSGLEPLPGGRVPYRAATMSLPTEGVFACGEMVTGPGAAVEAVAEGHRAASAIVHYLGTGELVELAEREWPTIGELPEQTAERVKPLSPVQVRALPTEERVRSFVEIEEGFTEAEARAEARRCLACTTGAFVDEERCVGCLTCVRICPFGVATVEKTAVIPQDQCLACGLCAAQCPAAAIALKRFGTNKMKEEVAARLQETAPGGRSRPLLVSYCCLFEVTSRRFVAREDSPEGEGVVRVMVPCVGRLSVVDLLAPFELGADGVVVISCRENECLYPTAEESLRSRVRQAKTVLAEIGLEEERIDLWRTEGSAEVSWTAFWELSRRKLRQLLRSKKESQADDSG